METGARLHCKLLSKRHDEFEALMPVGAGVTEPEHREVGVDGELADHDADDVRGDNSVVVEEIVLGEVLDPLLDVQRQPVARHGAVGM